LNPRPQIFLAQIYMFSVLFCISPCKPRRRTLIAGPAPLFLACAQGARKQASRWRFPRSRDGFKPPLPSPSACCCEARRNQAASAKRSSFAVTLFQLFYEVTEPRHAPLRFQPTSKPMQPQRLWILLQSTCHGKLAPYRSVSAGHTGAATIGCMN